MKDFNVINLNELTWHLNVALAGLVFAIFSLIYNEKFIYYGLLTFGFGVLSHITYKFFCLVLKGDNEGDMKWLWYYLVMAVLLAIWICSIFFLGAGATPL